MMLTAVLYIELEIELISPATRFPGQNHFGRWMSVEANK